MKKVTAALIIDNDKILITQRSIDDNLSLKWEFPGGKIEQGETPEECLEREIMEELGLRTSIQEFFMSSIYKYEFGDIELLSYFVEILDGQIQLYVHNDYAWVTPSELLLYDFAPADIEIVNALYLHFKMLHLSTVE